MDKSYQVIKDLTEDQKKVLKAISPFLHANKYFDQLIQNPQQLVQVLDNVQKNITASELANEHTHNLLHGIVRATLAFNRVENYSEFKPK